ncbi:hypothetical protein Tco_0485440 [Tanacetum coccineum]
MRTRIVLVPTKNQSWNVGSVARLVTSKGIAVVIQCYLLMYGLKIVDVFKTFRNQLKTDLYFTWVMNTFAPIHGTGSVALEFSSGKIVTLFNVLYVPKLRRT